MTIIQQPGPEQFPRQLIALSNKVDEFLLTLSSGGDFLTKLEDALIAQNIHSAGIKLLGGSFGALEYFTGIADPAGIRIATYGPPTVVEGPVICLSGNAILGHDANGEPTIHCHAVMSDASGNVIGGHLNKGGCAIGLAGVRLHITACNDAGFKVGYDAETTFNVFHPQNMEHPE